MTDSVHPDQLEERPVLVVDYGAQYAQLIARRVREAGIYSEIVPHSMSTEKMLAKNPAAIVLSGGPSSVYADGAPRGDRALFEAGVPVFGICYGFQVMAQTLGGTVAQTGSREYGATDATLCAVDSSFLTGTPQTQNVWMSHGDSVTEAPAGFEVLAQTPGASVAAFVDEHRKLGGVQWHPEVKHSDYGQVALENFLYNIAGLKPTWSTANIIEEQVAKIREQVGEDRVICALSGGVDSSVAAALVHKAVGDQLTCFFIDHGLLRAGEREQVEQDYAASMGIRVITIDESERFLTALAGVSDPEQKRKIIGREFIRSFEQAERIGLRQVDYKAIRALPAPEQELVRRAVEESASRDEVLGLLQELAARSAQKEQELQAQVRQEQQERAATEQRLSVVRQQKEQAEERAALIATLPPDEKLQRLRQEAAALAAQVEGLVLGNLRQALLALSQAHAGSDGAAGSAAFMAGLLAQVQAPLDALRAEFDLPDVAGANAADGDAVWMPPAEVLAALGAGGDERSIVDIGAGGGADGNAPVSFQA